MVCQQGCTAVRWAGGCCPSRHPAWMVGFGPPPVAACAAACRRARACLSRAFVPLDSKPCLPVFPHAALVFPVAAAVPSSTHPSPAAVAAAAANAFCANLLGWGPDRRPRLDCRLLTADRPPVRLPMHHPPSLHRFVTPLLSYARLLRAAQVVCLPCFHIAAAAQQLVGLLGTLQHSHTTGEQVTWQHRTARDSNGLSWVQITGAQTSMAPRILK